MVTAGLFNPSLEEPAVRVQSTEDRLKYIISWPAQAGATGYRVYAGFDPVHIRSLISGVAPLPYDQLSFDFSTPLYPPGQIVYFWAAVDTASGPIFISDVGSYAYGTGQLNKFTDQARYSSTTTQLIDTDDSLYYMEEIRRRAKAILEDTAEEVDLFIKQWRGLPDPTVQEQLGLDPNYQSMTRDDRTYGTGFYPGYFPAIRILMRFGNLPASLLEFQTPGLRPLLQNESWTVWDPIMHENDLIVRVSTGQRYAIGSTAFGNWRGVPITQRATLQIVSPTSPLQKITNTELVSRWGNVNSADYLRAGFGVAADAAGGPDFLIV
jgi:hypothetical protein